MSKWRVLALAGVLVGLGVLGIVGYNVWTLLGERQTEIETLNTELDEMSYQVDALGNVVEVYTVVVSKKSGSVFDQSDIDVMPIPSSQLNGQYITDLDMLRNCIYKIDVEPGMPLMKGLFFREVLSQTDRYHDVVADLFPVGGRVGDFYDLRIVTPNGLDYIVLSKKRVIEYYESAVRLVLSEEELHQYQSALVDTFINPGTYLYMTTYVEPAMQKRASIYYPVSDLVLAVLEIDPNVVQLAETDLIMRRRDAYEQGLEIDDETNGAIVAGRSEQIARIVAAGQAKLEESMAEQPSDGSGEAGAVDENGNLMSGTEDSWGADADAAGTDKPVSGETGDDIDMSEITENVTGDAW